MKKSLLILFLALFTLILQSQMGMRDSVSYSSVPQKVSGSEAANIHISIYPVPVTNNSFTIKADRNISFIKITNIIGQDIFKSRYNNPEQLIRITLDSPQRGMYLVTIIFNDGARIVKKIMIEESK
ncbi:MAG TPA: T9SS type A sorting domain-containing protein [Bacteroidales bacterium]|nr:T9SS type A sorting domain-containing protein [Bacteroidales bacterium]